MLLIPILLFYLALSYDFYKLNKFDFEKNLLKAAFKCITQ